MDKKIIILIAAIVFCCCCCSSSISGYFLSQTNSETADPSKPEDPSKAADPSKTADPSKSADPSIIIKNVEEELLKSVLKDNNRIRITHNTNNKCLDGNGKTLYFNDCFGNDEQSFIYTNGVKINDKPTNNIIHMFSKKCLDVDGGGNIVYSDCNLHNPSQSWEQINGKLLKNAKLKTCLDSDNTRLYLNPCVESNDYQGFSLLLNKK